MPRLVTLRYTYVEGMLERRKPHREAHLALAQRFVDDGRLLVVGALGDPPTGGLLVCADADAARDFAEADPYREAGLITSSEIEPWNVVKQRPLPSDD